MLSNDEIGWLLEDLCVRGGYCVSADARSRIAADPPSTPSDFSLVIVRAEGLDPEIDREAYRSVLEFVERAFRRSRSITPNER